MKTRSATRASRATQEHDQDHYEFFGPVLGPLGIMMGLPLTIVVLCVWCCPDFAAFFSFDAAAVFLGWMAFQGEVVIGVAPHKLPYKLTVCGVLKRRFRLGRLSRVRGAYASDALAMKWAY
jgi:hypothetical protein